MFPTIEHLDDILPHISLDSGIGHWQRDGYQVIDYTFVEKETFNSPHALECRGLKFAQDGRLIARPFHKFFNLGEKQRPDDVDFSQPHMVQEKRDGSMIHPAHVAGEMVFMTRKGRTDHADLALAHASDGVLALAQETLAAGITALFEFTSPMNRVVIAYDTPTLTLLAARHMTHGHYLSWSDLQDLAARHAVPLVGAFEPVADIKAFAAEARALEGREGYVIAFATGHRLKLKADAYVLRHKALDGLKFEKNVLAWIVGDALDDVAALLHPEMRDPVMDYASAVQSNLSRVAARLERFHATHKDGARKDCALAVQAQLDKRLAKVAFGMLDGRSAQHELRRILTWASHSETRVATIRDLIGVTWTPPDMSGLDD